MTKVFCEKCSKKQGKRVVRNVPLFPLYCACGTVYYSADANSDDPRWVPGSLCSHRGESTRFVECKACKGTVKLKVFACDVHSECTLKKNVGLHVCLGCDDWLAVEHPAQAKDERSDQDH
jgi:hypothetical protein